MESGVKMMPEKRIRVLFLCTHNSCRSQMAEGFARHLGGGIVEPHSAGTDPGTLHPLTVAVMKERGVDVSSRRAKGMADVPREIEVVVTVCDQAAKDCPVFPGAAKIIHWSLPDPARARGTPEEVAVAFRTVRDEIESRVRALVDQLRRGVP